MTEYARVYGGSLYDLAVEEKLTDAIKEEMLVIKGIFRENPEYIRLLCEPSIKKEERIDLIEKAFGDSTQRYLVSFLKLLCEKGILREFEGCLTEYVRRYNADNGIVEAVVTSAVALDEKQREALVSKLEKTSGKKVSLVERVEPDVVAGVKVEMEGVELDGTVSGRLNSLSRKLSDIKL
ncbi:MAG: ATP synthase F1 subunit delta [Lachnospiraceae bacterium]|nr:ATP synthase F1 subunit delta [Lachnospiraceae bacterium]